MLFWCCIDIILCIIVFNAFQISHLGGFFQILILVKTARQFIGLWNWFWCRKTHTIPETHVYRNSGASRQGYFSLLDLNDKSQIQSWLGSHGQVCIANPSSNILMHRRQHVERYYLGLRKRTWVDVNEWEMILLSVHNHSAAWLRMEITLFIACR